MKNKIFILGIVVLAVAAFFIAKNTNQKTEVVPTTPNVSQEAFVRPHSTSYGNSLGRVTVVEWFDPECESCRIVHPIVKKLISEYQDRVHFVLRYMPYHGNSLHAAAALEEAKEFGKFDQALDALYANQPEWGDHHNPRPELIAEYLSKLGIPKEKLEKRYLIEKHGEKVRQDETDGNAVGVRGTPTFFVNGQMVQQLGEEPLRAAIEEALKAGN